MPTSILLPSLFLACSHPSQATPTQDEASDHRFGDAAESDADTDSDGDADGDSDADADADSDADSDADADTDTTSSDTAGPTDTASDCDDATPVELFLSPDDSNSMSSPVQARIAVLDSWNYLTKMKIRPYEFMNYYDFDYPPADPGEVAVDLQMVATADPNAYEV